METKKSTLNYVEVRKCIENVPDSKTRIFLKALYLLGIPRPTELTSKRDPNSGNMAVIYGPKGEDSWLEEIDMPEPNLKQFLDIVKRIDNKEINPKSLIINFSKKIQVAVFKIKISKQKFDPVEGPPYRLIGLPINSIFDDPWTKELYDHFQNAGSNYVFPKKRLDYWYYIVKNGIFKNFGYEVSDYKINRKTISGVIKSNVVQHETKLIMQGLRYSRRRELDIEYSFDDLDWAAFTGAKIRIWRDKEYVREDWHRYIKKFCQKPSNIQKKKDLFDFETIEKQ